MSVGGESDRILRLYADLALEFKSHGATFFKCDKFTARFEPKKPKHEPYVDPKIAEMQDMTDEEKALYAKKKENEVTFHSSTT